ncbi:PREDICTED: uncharacterized protein LOC109173878 [Ipomoea nil]|uniref:uncharacterized protein LOC109173878 n=1 Tax=Ipomoea nil TaxID=35883 RepID=UPI00090157D7|nr:PREDICTED: uncharacterized protein LOC109173878 [Ipomoea nil]
MKSCYRHLSSQATDTRPWASIWNLSVPPKVRMFGWQLAASYLPTRDALLTRHVDWQLAASYLPTRDALLTRHVDCNIICHMCREESESAHHLFVACREALVARRKLGLLITHVAGDTVGEWLFNCIAVLSHDQMSKLLMLCWGLWTARNDVVWNAQSWDLELMLRRTMVFWENWGAAQCVDGGQQTGGTLGRWERPRRGRLKLNTDASVDKQHGRVGFGWVLRDDDGRFRAAKNGRMMGLFRAREAEAMCMREALSWLKDTGMGNVEAETYSQLLCNAIHSESFFSSFGFLVGDIKELASSINDVEFRFIKRSANQVAHTLARAAVSMPDCGWWFDVPPFFLVTCLMI